MRGQCCDKILLGSSIGPPIGTYAIPLIAPGAFFVYVVMLALIFTLFAAWRLSRREPQKTQDI